MRIRLSYLALLNAACLWAAAAQAADAVFPPGSRFGLVPPAGFEASPSGRGFEDRQNRSALIILEMPPQAIPDVEKVMTADALKKQGVIVTFRESVTLKDGKGTLIAGRQTLEGVPLRKWILLGSFGEAGKQTAAMVTAMVPDDVKGTYPDSALRNTLVSLEARGNVPVEELLSLLPYRLSDLGGMRPFRIEATTVYMTEGSKDTMEASEQPLFVVSAAPGGPAEPPQRENFARNLFSALPGVTNVRLLSSDIIRLGGIQTHQLLAEAKDSRTDADIKLVQWVRFGNGAFVRFVGMARADAWPDAFTRFRAIRDGVSGRS